MRGLFVLILFIFFPLGREAHRSANGVLVFLKNYRFFRCHINVSPEGCVSVLEIVFVGQCEVFFCLGFVHIFPPCPRSP